jgi:hypothetical protein
MWSAVKNSFQFLITSLMYFAAVLHMLLLNTKDIFPVEGRELFTNVHQITCEIGSLPIVSVTFGREVLQDMNLQENVLVMVQHSPHLSTRRIASHIDVLHMQV